MVNVAIPIPNRSDYVRESVSPARKIPENHDKSFFTKFIHSAKQYASVVDSRESVTRIALDVLAFDLPTMLAAATRGWANFAETVLE